MVCSRSADTCRSPPSEASSWVVRKAVFLLQVKPAADWRQWVRPRVFIVSSLLPDLTSTATWATGEDSLNVTTFNPSDNSLSLTDWFSRASPAWALKHCLPNLIKFCFKTSDRSILLLLCHKPNFWMPCTQKVGFRIKHKLTGPFLI